DPPPHPPPEVRGPADLQAGIVLLGSGSPGVPTTAATAAAYRGAYLGAQTAAGQPPLGLGGAEAGLGLGQGLVRLGAALNQRRQGVILESQPPVATGRPALRRHRLPALLVPNGGGVHGLGLNVVRPHSTGRQQNG